MADSVGYFLNPAQVSAVYITGSGTYTVTQNGANTFLVKIYAVTSNKPEQYTVIFGTQFVYTLIEKETYVIT